MVAVLPQTENELFENTVLFTVESVCYPMSCLGFFPQSNGTQVSWSRFIHGPFSIWFRPVANLSRLQPASPQMFAVNDFSLSEPEVE